MVSARRMWLAAAVVTLAAFLLYHQTLLPGQDLGDTASFQATVGTPNLTVRQAYPLYYATAGLFLRTIPGEPARAVNMASAVFAALACGLLTLIVGWLTGRLVAGLVAGLLYAVSYTFWSQAIIAEVYGLHAFMMTVCLLALLSWAARPTGLRLALFFALYAIGFGNHLQMILLLPGFALFLLLAAPNGPLSMFRPRVAILAVAMAALGAAQYLWNFQQLLDVPDRDPSVLEQLRNFWFDTTKADWRAMMVMGIPEGSLGDRIRMYWFDLHQQFGTPGVLLAAIGVAWMLWPGRLPGKLGRISRPRVGVALLVVFLVNWFFAFTYNVGDAHVFYLPSHLMVALVAGLGAAAVLTQIGSGGISAPTRKYLPTLFVSLTLVAYPAWRGFDTYPALDRSQDQQVRRFFDTLTAGLDGNHAVFATDLNWQLHNGLDYYAKYTRPGLAVGDTTEMLLYFPLVVEANRAMGRTIALTDGAAPMLTTAYGRLFEIERDARVPAPPFSARVGRFRRGTPYALTVLLPYGDNPVDRRDLEATVDYLTDNRVELPSSVTYGVITGRVGEPPATVRFDDRPFRIAARAGDQSLEVRMECWLPTDTIRRMGFGRVISHRAPALTIDRGASFVAFDEAGRPTATEYGWALLAPQPRWIIPLSR